MKLVEKWKEKGISLRITSILMLIVSIAITAALLFTAVETVRSFRRLAGLQSYYTRAGAELEVGSVTFSSGRRGESVMALQLRLWYTEANNQGRQI